MNSIQELQPEGAQPPSNSSRPTVNQSDPPFGYIHIERCPCCGAPAAKAEPRIASSPPAESLSPDRHGAFLSGYTTARVFFTYYECADCSARFCRTYYQQNQLDGLYGRQAENMVSVPLLARERTQDDYVQLLRRHSRMAGSFLEIGPDIGLFASMFAQA